MSVAFDASSTQTTNLSSTITWTHTPTGTPTGAGVMFGWVDVGGATISSVTYGGAACTQIGSTQTSGSGFWKTAIFGKANPASGAQTVTITFSLTLSHGGSGCAVTVTGSDTTTCFAGSGGATGTSATAGGTITSTTNGELAIDVLCDNQVTLSSYGAGQTERINTNPTSGYVFGSSKAVTASSTAMVENIANSSGEWAWSGASFKAAAASSAIAFRKTLSGIGSRVGSRQTQGWN